MRQQLYINNVAVDMPNELIKIKAESNIFADADKTMTAHSYSFTLPRTLTNDTLLANAFVPAADTGGKTTHRYLDASLHFDGVPIFERGTAVLTDVDEKGYKMNLYWGVLDIFERIKEEGLAVRDLVMSRYITQSVRDQYDTWYKLPDPLTASRPYVSGMNNDIYNTLDDESKAKAGKMPWSLPVVAATRVLALIQAVYGITFNFSALAAQRISGFYHPMTSMRSLATGEKLYINIRGGWDVDGSTYIASFGTITRTPDTSLTEDERDIEYSALPFPEMPPTLTHSASNAKQANNAINLTNTAPNYRRAFMTARSKFRAKSLRISGTSHVIVNAEVNGERATSTPQGSNYRIDYTWSNVDVEQGDDFLIFWSDTTVSASSAPLMNINIQLEIDEIGDIEVHRSYSHMRNFPSMKVVEYLSEMLAHAGASIIGSINRPRVVDIVTWDEIVQGEAVGYEALGLKNISMRYGSLAQTNNYEHQKNDDTGIDYTASGKVEVDDTTLAAERKAFGSRFKVPFNAMVRLWRVEKNDDSNKYNATWVASGDYICGVSSTSPLAYRNTGQDFASVIESNYTSYKATMRQPKVIKASVRLSPLELVSLDMAKPVYLRRYGRKYIIVNITNDSDDNYTMELIQI